MVNILNVHVPKMLCFTHSVRGSLDAYILAFDRHYNMLLSDVDEEYITNSVSNRNLSKSNICVLFA